jgi:hypothetical protein
MRGAFEMADHFEHGETAHICSKLGYLTSNEPAQETISQKSLTVKATI